MRAPSAMGMPSPVSPNLPRARLTLVRLGVAAFYTLLSVAATWPLARDFATRLTGDYDAVELLWMMWNTRLAMLGHSSLIFTDLLYYPAGANLLTNSLQPTMALLALPFWPWGPAAAYNGTQLVASVLTGCGMYLLARDRGLARAPALLAGTALLMAPLRLAAYSSGHLHKTLLALIPLGLMFALRGLNPARSRGWLLATAAVLLATLLNVGDQFLYSCIAVGLAVLYALASCPPQQRGNILGRAALLAFSLLVLTGPWLILTYQASLDPRIEAVKSLESLVHQPDLVNFVLPSTITSRLWAGILDLPGMPTGLRYWVEIPSSEQSVYLTLTLGVLALIAVLRRAPQLGIWLVIGTVSVVLSLGPRLSITAHTALLPNQGEIWLPFAWLNTLPGFNVIRTPGRMMEVGYTALAMCAGLGLTAINARVRRAATLIAMAGLLFETFPAPPHQVTLPPIPAFYTRIAADPERYGVLDLPIRPFRDNTYLGNYVTYSHRAMLYQITHGKPIAAGHVSRLFHSHPVFPQWMNNSTLETPDTRDVLVNGRPADRYANAANELARAGYRYIVVHKPQPGDTLYGPGAWGEGQARLFVARALGAAAVPSEEDGLVRVYQVPPESAYTATLVLQDTEFSAWVNRGDGPRQMLSPARFYLAATRAGAAQLRITPRAFYDPPVGTNPSEAEITLTTDRGETHTIQARASQTLTLPLTVQAGSQTITLTVRYHGDPPRADGPDMLNMEFQTIELITP